MIEKDGDNMPTKIEWTGESWNPIRGCSRVSEGCDNCYAIGQARRFKGNWYKGCTKNTDKGVDWTGKILVVKNRMDLPYHWRKPRLVFVNSMSDIFHSNVSTETIMQIFKIMNETPQHEYQVLTKRPDRLLKLDRQLNWTRNIWMGVTIENDKVTNRLDKLLKCGAQVKYLSLEPLIGPLASLPVEKIDWVIVAAESGQHYRPMDPEWVRQIRDNCKQHKVPFFFKGWGGFPRRKNRVLDNQIWSEYPTASKIR